MKRRAAWSSVGLLIAVAGAGAMFSPATEPSPDTGPTEEQKLGFSPATQPEQAPEFHVEVRPIPAEYQILSRRSIFTTRPLDPEGGPVADTPPSRPEREFVLRGVASQQGVFQAFVERVPKSRILRLVAGDAVARGRVRRITLGGLDYEANGLVTRIAIGFAFDGTRQEPVEPPSTQPDEDGETPRRKTRKFKTLGEAQSPDRPKTSPN
ncbi:MAG TPA: hypothetical protein VLJ39_13170 [Tepidisphaeraceae bacterium]|nr:hypothetical protein [Tepidisphaeraceae bacterium]